jgi:ppGpp synthetase/RelA/SpoT-type nucleotidyltranferase
MKREDIPAWLQDILPHHDRLKEVIIPLMVVLLKQKNIEYLSINGRTKDFQSAMEKIKRKKYVSPREEMTDMTGIRVITFFDSHVRAISDLINDVFDVDTENSLNRSALLGMDRLGYRSVHFVCTLGEERSKLPEFKNLGHLKFEIQARTVLQHAWAELAHDRTYKFPGVLPFSLERKLNLYSGMLEIADAAFDEIASQIDRYKEEITSGELHQTDDTLIDSINVKKNLDKYAIISNVELNGDVGAEIIEELRLFGIENIGSLDELLKRQKDFLFTYKEDFYYAGTIRDAMMLDDIDKYFAKCWRESWSSCGIHTVNRLTQKYDRAVVESILNDRDIYVIDEDEYIDYSMERPH